MLATIKIFFDIIYATLSFISFFFCGFKRKKTFVFSLKNLFNKISSNRNINNSITEINFCSNMQNKKKS